MLGLISGLVLPAPLAGTRSVEQTSAGAGTQLPVARTPTGANDSFSVAVGTTEAADIGALTEARRNADAGASLLRVADKGLDKIGDALTRMKELAKQASKTPPSILEGAILNAEFEGLRAEIDRIADQTEFDNIKVLQGTQLAFKVGTGTASRDSITVSLSAATVASLNAGLASDKITSASGAGQALTNVTSAIDALKNIQSTVDGAAVRFQGAQRNLATGKNILTDLRTDLLERPVTIGTADHLSNLVREQFLARAAPAAAGRLSSVLRALVSTSQLQPIETRQVDNQALSRENTQTEAAKPPSTYETGHDTKSSSHGEPYQGVDIEA